jgi:putative DNA methylase
LAELRKANIAPVDLAQAAIGPGMAVYSRYSQILEADGSALSTRRALAIINEELDKILAELDGDLDGQSRLCLALFTQFGFGKFKYGAADVLARAKNASLLDLKAKKIIFAEKGIVRLSGLDELPRKINPNEENVWLFAHQLTKALKTGGINQCAKIALLVNSPEILEKARRLSYLLHDICERKNWAGEAFDYNSLAQAYPEIMEKIASLSKKSS